MNNLYIAMTGGIAHERRMAAIANNLANLGSAGFKKEVPVFEMRRPEVRIEAMERGTNPDLGLPPIRSSLPDSCLYTRLAETRLDFTPGLTQPTSDSMCVAIEERQPDRAGRAFFVVDTPQGERLTRAGNFTVNSRGELVTQNGYTVQGQSGPIKAGDGNISVGSDGTVSIGETRDHLRLVWTEQPELLEKVGHSLFRNPNNRAIVRDVRADDPVAVRQGYLELSNVNVVDELVRMIETTRLYTSYQKTIQTMDDATAQSISLTKE